MKKLKLSRLRKKIDKVDKKIILLLSKRDIISKRIGLAKNQAGMKIQDPLREKEAMTARCHLADRNKLDTRFIRSLFKSIFTHSVSLQKNIPPPPPAFDKNLQK